MNTDDDTPQNNPGTGPADDADIDGTAVGGSIPGERRPLGYWLRAVDALLTREFAAAFEGEGVTRRDWMILNVLSGDVEAPGAAERLARKGKRLRRLEDLGWVHEQGDGTWTLTDDGRAARQRLSAAVDDIRARVAGAVSPEEFATTMASLEAIARELGWDEASGFPRRGGSGPWGRGFGGPRPFRPDLRFGWGPNLHHGFGPGRPGRPGDPRHSTSHGDAWAGEAFDDGCRTPAPHAHHGRFGHGYGWGSGQGGHAHGWGGHEPGHGHGRGHGHRKAERAYERGFAAGFGAAQAGPADPHVPGTAA